MLLRKKVLEKLKAILIVMKFLDPNSEHEQEHIKEDEKLVPTPNIDSVQEFQGLHNEADALEEESFSDSSQVAESEDEQEVMKVDKKRSPTISSSSTLRVKFTDRNLADLRRSHFGFAPTEQTGDKNSKWLQTGVSYIQEKSPLSEQGAEAKHPTELWLESTDVGDTHNVVGVSYFSKQNKKYDIYLGQDLSSDEKTILRSRVLGLIEMKKQKDERGHPLYMKIVFTAIYRNGVMVKTSRQEARMHCTPFLSFAALNILTPFNCRRQYKNTEMINIYDFFQNCNYPSPGLFSEGNKQEKVDKPFHFLPEYSPIKEAMKKKKKTSRFNIKNETSFGAFFQKIYDAIKDDPTEPVTEDILSRRPILLKFYTHVEDLMEKKRLVPQVDHLLPSQSTQKIRRQRSKEMLNRKGVIQSFSFK